VAEPTRLTNADEVFLRQVHPSWLPDGVLTSAAFKPSSKDNKLLSTLHGSVGAEEAHRRWVDQPDRVSAGTWGVTVGEVDNTSFTRTLDQQTVSLAALDDAEQRSEPDHVSIDFRNLSKEQRGQAARKLKDHAAARGCMHAALQAGA
jgi:hypothetical protein